ncbi:MAG TPA: murein L,D-transpeptidase catalytic domain family protein [Bacteroidales bacterium]|nr:murein L,D-transpeptidase catalytic domain family protein [Bacteroidales bacterium]
MIRHIFFITFLLILNGEFVNQYDNFSVQKQDPVSVDFSTWKEKLIHSSFISEPAINLALNGFLGLKDRKLLTNDSMITIIDFSLPSTQERLYILDIKNQKIIKKTLVAHGMNTGDLLAEFFSNEPESLKSSLGLYITQETYFGNHGYSLRIKGVSKGLNDNAEERAIVIHGAEYVSYDFIESYGRIGRSFGCPALPIDETNEIIDLIKGGSCLYIYHPSMIPISPSDLEKFD